MSSERTWAIASTPFRILGWFADSLIYWVVALLISSLLPERTIRVAGRIESTHYALAPNIFVIEYCVFDFGLIIMFGMTAGKWLLGERVSISKTEVVKPRAFNALKRMVIKTGAAFFCLSLIPVTVINTPASVTYDLSFLIGLITLAVRASHQGWHDTAARTFVLRQTKN